jgi:hypothetical protein
MMPGSPGTCEAQSFGYGLGSYTVARLPDGSAKWNPALPQNSVSPAYLFALSLSQGPNVATCPKGGLALEYLAQLVASGAPTRARVPYQPSCDYFNMIENQADFPESYPEMQPFSDRQLRHVPDKHRSRRGGADDQGIRRQRPGGRIQRSCVVRVWH